MKMLERATDWMNQTNEERAELCASFLFVHGFMGHADKARTLNRIRATGDIQREARIKERRAS